VSEPRISVVIPTLNRPDALPRTLAALARQTLDPQSFEVIVVTDVKNEAPPAPYPERLRIRTLAGERPGVSSARNVGWHAAQAPLVMFLGDDIIGVPELVAEHLSWHEQNADEEVGVLGHVRWARELKRDAFMAWLDRGIQFDYPLIRANGAGPGHFYTANVSLKRAMLERVGGFDAERFPFGYEDIDLGLRLFQHGFRLLYNPAADAEHLHQPDLEQWKRRMGFVGVAERRWIERYPGERPYFHDRFSEALSCPPLNGRRGRLLMRWVPKEFPVIGRSVWENGDLWFRQQLAPAFMEAWEKADRA